MQILITGGAGYIGSHAARELTRRGHQVRLYDNLSTGHRFLAGASPLIEADLRDREILALSLRGVDAVMHFAAHAYVGESVQNPRKYFINNVEAGLCLLHAVLDAGIRFFVFSSSCAVYGVPSNVPIRENEVRQPVNPYGASKLFFEHALEAYGQAYDLRFVSLRYFNAAGADEGGEIGELHQPETHLIPLGVAVAAGMREALDIYGTDYPTPDGTCIRDYVHVNDLACAHALALEHLAGGGDSLQLNLGTGTGHSVKEIISTIERVTARAVPVRHCPRRPGDPPVLVADPCRARDVLRWVPTRSLDDIVAGAWNWLRTYSQPRRLALRA